MLSKDLQLNILQIKKQYSIYALWSEPELFRLIIDELAKPFKDKQIDKVLGLEARGFILGAPVAYVLSAGFVVARKQGRMYPDYPESSVISESAIDYSGKLKTLEIETNAMAIQKGDRVLIVDDWFETGGQGTMAIKLVEKAGGVVAGISIMLDDMQKDVRLKFRDFVLNALVIKDNNPSS